MTSLWAGQLKFNSWQEQIRNVFTTAYISTLGSIQWVLGSLPGVTWPGHKASSAKIENEWSYFHIPPIYFHGLETRWIEAGGGNLTEIRSQVRGTTTGFRSKWVPPADPVTELNVSWGEGHVTCMRKSEMHATNWLEIFMKKEHLVIDGT
jgi:hypothetical protein